MTVSGPRWTAWRPFPVPRRICGLHADMFGHRGAGVYELRLRLVCRMRAVLFGQAEDVRERMCSLLPLGFGGHGTRKNHEKRVFVLKYLRRIEYRIAMCEPGDLNTVEMFVKRSRTDWVFPEQHQQRRRKNPR